MNNIILIGFMGAGKTTVGRILATKRGMDFIDTDQMIEELAGMSISRIFALQGEEVFRRMETETLQMLQAGTDHAVISAGGGLPLRRENRELLKGLGTVVYLVVSKDTVLERLKGDTARPLLQGTESAPRVEALLQERDPLYGQAAHRTVDTDGKTVQEIVEEVEEKMEDGQ